MIKAISIDVPEYIPPALEKFCAIANIPVEEVSLVIKRCKRKERPEGYGEGERMNPESGDYHRDKDYILLRISKTSLQGDVLWLLAHELGHKKQAAETGKPYSITELYANRFAILECGCYPDEHQVIIPDRLPYNNKPSCHNCGHQLIKRKSLVATNLQLFKWHYCPRCRMPIGVDADIGTQTDFINWQRRENFYKDKMRELQQRQAKIADKIAYYQNKLAIINKEERRIDDYSN